MKTVFRLTVTAVLCACAASGWAQDAAPDLQEPITLDQALEIAFRYNPNIRIAVDQVQRARGVVAEANANFMPKFNAEVVHIRQGPPISFTEPSVGTIDIVPGQNTMADAGVFLPIDISRKLGYTSDISKLQFQIDYLGLVAAAENLIFEVKGGYFQVLRAVGQQGVAQSAVDVAKRRLKDTQARFRAGAVAKFDVTRAEVDVANLNQILIQARTQVLKATTLFNSILGIDVNTPTRLVDTEIVVRDVPVDVPQRIGEAYAQRSEVKSADISIDLNKRNVRLQRTGILPSLGAAGIYNYDFGGSGFSSANESWSATLNLQIPIWDGGITKAKVEQAHADVQKSKDTLDQVKLRVGRQVRVAALNLEEAMERTRTTAEGVELAEETLRLATVRYDAGIAILVEVTDAESALTEAKFNLVQAQYDYALAVAELERATAAQPEIDKVQIIAAGLMRS